MAEILKLKGLTNEHLESSWGALWLGIRTSPGFKILGAIWDSSGGQLAVTWGHLVSDSMAEHPRRRFRDAEPEQKTEPSACERYLQLLE